MVSANELVVSTLEGYKNLISLLGGYKVYYMVAKDEEEYPYITFFEITNFDNNFYDNKDHSSEIHMQIDIWNNDSCTEIAKEVDKALKQKGFSRTGSTDLYEKKVFHKALRYKIVLQNN